jgi:hypothetical protein
MDCACEGVYSGWNMHVGNESPVSSGRKKAPGENPSGCICAVFL